MMDEKLKLELAHEITKYLVTPSVVNILVASTGTPTVFSVRCLNNT